MSVKIIDTLKPKNNGTFPVAEAVDVAVEGYSSLADAVTHFATDTMIAAINAVLSGKANTSDVNTAVSNLQNQINQIEISASAEAVVAPEVAAARVGTDGTSHVTLKARLDAEDNFNLDNTKQVSNNVDALCDVVGVGFLPKSKSATLATNSKHFLNVGNLKSGKKYTFAFTINKTAAQAVYFSIKNDSTTISTRNIAAGSTTHTYEYTADSDYNDVYIDVTLYEELTVSVEVSATGFNADKITQNQNDISVANSNVASTNNDIAEIVDLIGAKFIPKKMIKTVDGTQNHFLDIGNLYYGATYTFAFTINKVAAKPVYFSIKHETGTISTRNIAAGDTSHSYTFQAEDLYKDCYIDVIDYEELTVTINVTATGYGDDQITKNKDAIAALQIDVDRVEATLDDFIVDVSDYTDVTSQATYHSFAFVSWFSLTPTEASGWQYLTLEVSAGEVYQVKSYGGSSARNWIFAVDGAITDYCRESAQEERTVEVTIAQNGVLYVNNNTSQTTASIKLKNYKAGVDGEKVYIGTEAMDEKLAEGNTLYKKIICCCGDSITYGDDMDQDGFTDNPDIDVYQWSSSQWNKLTSSVRMTWGYQIASRNNMTFYNGGVNGSTMQGISEKNGFSLENGRYTQLPNNIDYLVIFFGWNDTAYGELGTISDATNESYYGGYNVVIPYLQNKYPYAKICLVVPFGCDAGHRNAIRQLCNKWGLACFDMYGAGTPLYYGKEDSVGVEQSVVTANRAKFQANGAHPNYKGHKQIADMLENFLRGI